MNKQKIDSVEKDRMKQLIICKLCHETLEDPIILPCAKTCCKFHVNQNQDLSVKQDSCKLKSSFLMLNK